jgi:SlyX protein
MTSPPDSNEALEQRFVKLETKLAYQEKTIADLNDVVVVQDRQIDKLERRVAALEQQIAPFLGQEETIQEKPPHY